MQQKGSESVNLTGWCIVVCCGDGIPADTKSDLMAVSGVPRSYFFVV